MEWVEFDDNPHMVSEEGDKEVSLNSHIDIKQEVMEITTIEDQNIFEDADLDLSEEFLYTVLQQVDNLCEIITNGDPSLERRLDVNQNLNEAISCYKVKLLYKQVKTESQDTEGVKNEITSDKHNFMKNEEIFDIDRQDQYVDELVQESNSETFAAIPKGLKTIGKLVKKKKLKKRNVKSQETIVKERQLCENRDCMKKFGSKKSELWCKKCLSYDRLLQNIDNKKLESKEYDITAFQLLKYEKESDNFGCLLCSDISSKLRGGALHHIKNQHKKEMETLKGQLTNLDQEQKESCESSTCKRFYGIHNLFLWCKKCALGQKSPRLKKDYDISTFEYLKYNKESDLYFCSVCEKSANFKNLILRHAKSIHQKGEIFSKSPKLEQKEDCGSKTCKKLYGTSHIILWCKQCILLRKLPKKSKKGKKKKVTYKLCPDCGKSVQGLNQHLKQFHDNTKQKCLECNIELKNIFSLNNHMKYVHEKIPCPECGRQIGVGKMTCHLKMHEKRFKCDVCGKGFGTKDFLKDHTNIHTGERPYKCKYCSADFASRGNMRMHERGHEGRGRNYSKKSLIKNEDT